VAGETPPYKLRLISTDGRLTKNHSTAEKLSLAALCESPFIFKEIGGEITRAMLFGPALRGGKGKG
jgi:hypothetical protein